MSTPIDPPKINTRMAMARVIDHTILKPQATDEDIIRHCAEAQEFGLWAVCIAPCWVSLASRCLRDTCTNVVTVIGFPHGNTLTQTKAYEAEQAIVAGAQELDMVINIGLLRSGKCRSVEEDIASVVRVAQCSKGCLVKVIIETALLADEEKSEACRIIQSAGADFVKTSTGFSTAGASIEDVSLIRSIVGPSMGIKAAGGIRDLATAQRLIDAGATRLGCSASINILMSLPN